MKIEKRASGWALVSEDGYLKLIGFRTKKELVEWVKKHVPPATQRNV